MKQQFIELLLQSGVLKFGEFKTKSGRLSPYFFNTGNFDSGQKIKKLAMMYAKKIAEIAPDTTVLYGPAYKGIPLAVAIAAELSELLARDIHFTFNRKEAKDHGEGGIFVGHNITPADKVLIVEDVLTGGTSLRETMQLLNLRNIHVLGSLVGIDRQEKGLQNISAKSELEQQFNLKIFSIVNLSDIIETLYNREVLGKIWIDANLKSKIDQYISQYGA